MATVPITSAVTLTVGTTADTLTNGGDFCPGGKFPRGIVIVQDVQAGTVHLRHDGTATTAYPSIPQGTFANGIPITAEAIKAGVSVIASVADQTVRVYPL
jgi:hypothetical protein